MKSAVTSSSSSYTQPEIYVVSSTKYFFVDFPQDREDWLLAENQ